MVRGNWQKRVESADARRKEAKQKKQKSEDKRVFKGWMQSFMGQLDRHESILRKRKSVLHLWTDVLPSSAPPLLDLVGDANGRNHNKRRPRTSSIESEGSNTSGKKGRGRSDSASSAGAAGGGSPKKKVHPRSKEASSTPSTDVDNLSDMQLLCRRHFLMGKCDNFRGNSGGGGRKSGGCTLVHYSNPKFFTVATAVGPNTDSAIRDMERAAFANVSDGIAGAQPNAMEMVYYLRVDLFRQSDSSDPDSENNVSDRIAEALSKAQAPVASVVYGILDNIPVYDRNQQGMLLSDEVVVERLEGRVLGRPRNSSVGSESEGDQQKQDLVHLPAAILEHMLTFLPDTAVAACAQVCQAWSREIGQNSPNLWLHLLDRRKWPAPADAISKTNQSRNTSSDDDDGNHRSMASRAMFLQHYTAMRDLRALASALPSMTSKTQVSVLEKEMTYQTFSTRKHVPSPDDYSVGVEIWSANHVLVGYAKECSLRLFEAVPFRGSEKRCKELVYQSVDPYKSTKKRSCTLDAMGLDEDYIGCLCRVSASTLVDKFAFILVVLSRDDFLLGESSDAGAKGGGSHSAELKVIDIGAAVLNYILSSDVVDHRLLPMFDYLSDGGEVGDIVTTVSRRNLGVCGYGRFMVEISISIPSATADDGETEMVQLDRKLVLFSAGASAIVWVGDSYPSPGNPPATDIPVVMGCLRRPHMGATRTACTIAVSSTLSPVIMSCEIEPSGHVEVPRVLEESGPIRTSMVEEGYQPFPSRALVVTQTDIIAKDSIYRAEGEEQPRDQRSCLFFFPRFPAVNEKAYDILELGGKLRIHDMVGMHTDYVVALCTELQIVQATDEEDGANLEGQWFVPPAVSVETTETSCFLLVHVPSRREIGRVPCKHINGVDNFSPLLSESSGKTIGLSIGPWGVVMTGDDVRHVTASSQCTIVVDDRSPTKKKKKPARGKKGGKKDGFARGMSLRG